MASISKKSGVSRADVEFPGKRRVPGQTSSSRGFVEFRQTSFRPRVPEHRRAPPRLTRRCSGTRRLPGGQTFARATPTFARGSRADVGVPGQTSGSRADVGVPGQTSGFPGRRRGSRADVVGSPGRRRVPGQRRVPQLVLKYLKVVSKQQLNVILLKELERWKLIFVRTYLLSKAAVFVCLVVHNCLIAIVKTVGLRIRIFNNCFRGQVGFN